MISKLWFYRNSKGLPVLAFKAEGKYEFLISEELYCQWVPDTNGPAFVGENVKEGIVYDKPLKANLKA